MSKKQNLTDHPLSTQPRVQHYEAGLMWFRRDLRLDDNAALFYALRHCKAVHCVFVFDKTILNALENKADRRVEFIRESCVALQEKLRAAGGDLHLLHDHAETAVAELATTLKVQAVFTNKDYEPAARKRDDQIQKDLKKRDVDFLAFKDQAIFEESELLTQAKSVFGVFTPYKNAWMKKLERFYLTPYPVKDWLSNLHAPQDALPTPSLEELGFEKTNLLDLIEPAEAGALATFDDFLDRIARYKTARNFPAIKGVSYLSVHMRFGTLSIRRAARAAFDRMQAHGCEGSATWLSELIWRDFYFQILFHRPDVAEQAFKPEYDQIQWERGEQAEKHFLAWCKGETGFPLVDAAMRQLNQTGFQHNRLRMLTASFLSKDLGIDWRRGEAYFARQLNDFDLSANNGGWQWAASTGCDAQPYFRIFNPYTQSEKFDAQGKFIRRYCPELAKLSDKHIHDPATCPPMELKMAGVVLEETYPKPIVQHDEARKKTLERYAVVKKKSTL